MARADFYIITRPRFASEPLRLVCELARRCHDAGLATTVLARDQAQADLLDGLLWEFDEAAYVPHQIAGLDEDDAESPVLIVTPEIAIPDRLQVINLREAAFRGTCERVLEVVPADPAAREPLRKRWFEYQARGFDLHRHEV